LALGDFDFFDFAVNFGEDLVFDFYCRKILIDKTIFRKKKLGCRRH